MLEFAKRYEALGFALLWLRPRSKAPIETGWTRKPVASYQDLEKSYRDHYNVGVRLGSPSKFPDGTYLAVLDCDVKTSDPKAIAEMEKTLAKIITAPGIMVLSGRGNGSRHIYIRTKTPARTTRLAQAAGEKVKVKMPSTCPSGHEVEALTKKEIEAGIRLRSAWEISLMGENGQVVLPPSVHPDTGREYSFSQKEWGLKDIPLFEGEFEESKKRNPVIEKIDPSDFQEIYLTDPRFNPNILERLLGHVETTDRSSALFGVACHMIKSDFTDREIISTLTHRDFFLGNVAYDHTKSDSRLRAAEWIKRYTLEPAHETIRAEAASDFSGEIPAEDPDAEPEPEKTGTKGWRNRLERTSKKDGSRVKSTSGNVRLILENSIPAGEAVFRYDLFNDQILYGIDPPWGLSSAGKEVRDRDLNRILFFLQDHFRFEPSTDKIFQAVKEIAHANRFHPVRDFIDGLVWDGKPRLDQWLQTYLGAIGSEKYLSEVGRKALCAMIARVFDPGCKFDTVLILEGPQGCGKSTTVRILAGEAWHGEGSIHFHDKDLVMAMSGKWIFELGELAGMNRADTETLKAFLSRPVDRVRLPYERAMENYPRQCIFVGTTNSMEYIKDETGGRRFWPVKMTRLDRAALMQDRDQLLAEAKTAHALGEALYLDEDFAVQLALVEQEKRAQVDELAQAIAEFLDEGKFPLESFDADNFTLSELFELFAVTNNPIFAQLKFDPFTQRRVASGLRANGFESKRTESRRFWTKAKKKSVR